MMDNLISDFCRLIQVEAIALGGSRAVEHADSKSDYDVYLYCASPIPEEIRHEILSRYCSYMELGNTFWETEDNCRLKTGFDIDILYRNLDDFTKDLEWIVEKHHARNGYSTCMWYNLLTSQILFDRSGKLTALQERFRVPYPQELKKEIIGRNMKLLAGFLPSYAGQIQKAALRGDTISLGHRSAAFFESYFDIIFALNELPHPGEKRLISLASSDCKLLPDGFEACIQDYYSNLFSNTQMAMKILENIIENLQSLVGRVL